MKKVFGTLIIGIIAGIIDVTPMIVQRIDKYACISAFVQWIVLGLIIPYVNWNLKPWLKGFIIAEISALPIMILVLPKEPESLVPIMIFSAVLGALVGTVGAKLVR